MLMSPQTPLIFSISLLKNLVLISVYSGFYSFIGLQAPLELDGRYEKNQQQTKEFPGTILQHFMQTSSV